MPTARFYAVTQLFPSYAATHNGDIAISRTPLVVTLYDIQLFENGHLPLIHTSAIDCYADGNAVYFSNHFKDVVYSSYQDDTSPRVTVRYP